MAEAPQGVTCARSMKPCINEHYLPAMEVASPPYLRYINMRKIHLSRKDCAKKRYRAMLLQPQHAPRRSLILDRTRRNLQPQIGSDNRMMQHYLDIYTMILICHAGL
jgi:hypothetical protein